MAEKPKAQNSLAAQEMEKAEQQIDRFEKTVKDLTLDRMNEAPAQDLEPQTKIATKDLDKMNDIYLKPKRAIMSKERFNEDYRKQYTFAKEYVQFIAEHNELKGDTIEMWTKAFAGVPAEYWEIPSNKPVWGPRYLAEQISRCKYHRLRTENRPTTTDGNMQYYGDMVVDTTINRIDAKPVGTKRSVFMGGASF